MKDDYMVDRLKAAVAGRNEVVFAYLFGSRAKGTAGGMSDIDVAVFVDEAALKKPYPYGYRADLTTHLMRALGTNKVDCVALNGAGPLLRHQVIKYGVALLCRDERARMKFWVRTMQAYDDAKGILAIQRAYHKERSGTVR